MKDLILHPDTKIAVADVVASPPHALLLLGASGIGKSSVARGLAAQLLDIDPAKVSSHPYASVILPTKENSISIEEIRQLIKFMTLKVPGAVRRVAIVEDAHLLTTEAQNAFLKTLEEPPEGTTVILTSSSEHALLPTIRSRVSILEIKRPGIGELEAYFCSKGYAFKNVQQAMLMSVGLPGLTSALLKDDSAHPLVAAAQTARQLLRQPTFERLIMVDTLAKQRVECLNILSMMQQMAHMALQQAAGKSTAQAKIWQRVLTSSYRATELLLLNAQVKLVLTDLMLNL